jgi:arginyl-tRNA synthetase
MSIDIINRLSKALSPALGISEKIIYPLIETPPDTAFGDFAVPCFTFAKELKKNPSQIAADFEDRLSTNAGKVMMVRSAQARGPYLNIFVEKSFIVKEIVRNLSQISENLLGNIGKGKTVVIDFSSPNIAKPFGIGHLRSTVIGSSLYKIFNFLGYRVIGINHLGDWGTQFGKLITAFKKWGDERNLKKDPIKYLLALYVRFHTEAKKQPSLDDEARNWFYRLENKDKEAERLWEEFRALSLDVFKKIYKRLGVEFDYYTGESFYSDLLDKTLSDIEKAGIMEESEGALVVKLDEDLPPALLKKSDEATLYMTRDIAAAVYRHENFNFDLALYVVGSPQSLHFRQLFRVLKKMGLEWSDSCHHIPFGHIRFAEGSMGTRKGNIVFLEDVLNKAKALALSIIDEKNPDLDNKEEIAEAVGIGSIIFNDLKNNRIKDITFEWDDVLNFNGETGPYLQYTHARINSLLNNYNDTYGAVEFFDDLPFSDEGYAVAVKINSFENVILRASKEFEPSVISRYLLELASEFNSYYNAHRVITDDKNLSLSRALLVRGVRSVLKRGLELLGLKAVDEM